MPDNSWLKHFRTLHPHLAKATFPSAAGYFSILCNGITVTISRSNKTDDPNEQIPNNVKIKLLTKILFFKTIQYLEQFHIMAGEQQKGCKRQQGTSNKMKVKDKQRNLKGRYVSRGQFKPGMLLPSLKVLYTSKHVGNSDKFSQR